MADSFPRVKASMLHCSYTEEERARHEAHENDLTGKLIASSDGGKKTQVVDSGGAKAVVTYYLA